MPVASETLFPCNVLKTLTIGYTGTGIMPSGGFTVKWRVVGSDTWFTVPNKTTNPIYVPGVPTCYPLEIELYVDCGNGLQLVESFGVSATTSTCYEYELLDEATYRYVPCGTTTVTEAYNLEGSGQTICAVEGSVEGDGKFTRVGKCNP